MLLKCLKTPIWAGITKKELAIWVEKTILPLSIETLSLPGLGESSVEPCSVIDLKPGGREQFGQNGALLGTYSYIT